MGSIVGVRVASTGRASVAGMDRRGGGGGGQTLKINTRASHQDSVSSKEFRLLACLDGQSVRTDQQLNALKIYLLSRFS